MKQSTLIRKTLYIISTESLQYPTTIDRRASGQTDIKRGCIFKIGEAIDTDLRIESLDGTFVFEKPIKLHEWLLSPMTDKQVHAVLEKNGRSKYRQDKDREFFEFDSLEQAIREVNNILFGTKNHKTYSEREEQTDIIDGVYNLFRSGESTRALVNAKMRCGKCHIAYKIAKKMDIKRVLILTYKPSGVRESWEDDIDHVAFKDFTFKNACDMSEVKFDKNSNKTQVIFASFQDALGKDGNKSKWISIRSQDIDMIVKDEDHYGYETERSNAFLSKLNYEYELSLSGTPFKAILDGKYDKNEVFVWTYLQEQAKRNAEMKGGWQTDVYRGLPAFRVHLCKFDAAIVKEFSKQYADEEKVTCTKLFSNEKMVYQFLSWIKTDRNMKKLIANHMFWYLPGVLPCDIIEKVMKTHPYWKDYAVVNASADSVKDLDETKRNVYNKKPHTVTLSCGRWNTGSTVPQWESVWMLDDGFSAENWFQTSGRCGSPWVTPSGEFLKEKVNVVDFNQDRMLRCLIEYSSVMCKQDGSTPSEYSTKMLECMPIFSVGAAGIEQINADALITHFNEFVTNSFGSARMIDGSKLNAEIKLLLKNVIGNLSEETKIALNNNSTGRGKNGKRAIMTMGTKGTLVKDEEWVVRGRVLTHRFMNFLFVVDDLIERVDDIFSHTEEFETLMGFDVDSFKTLVDDGFIREEELNENIALYNINNEYIFAQ